MVFGIVKTTVVYNYVSRLTAGFENNPTDLIQLHSEAEEWLDTYQQNPAGIDHELLVVCTGELSPLATELFRPIHCRFESYTGDGWDLGAFQYAWKLLDSDLAFFCNARIRFWKGGWLRRMAEARERHGEGLYSSFGSFEVAPHLRTSGFAANPRILRTFPHEITCRDDTFKFESGEWNVTNWFLQAGYKAMMVTWDGEYEQADWRVPDNIFRRGDQSRCLVWDRHTQVYAGSNPGDKRLLESITDGKGWPK